MRKRIEREYMLQDETSGTGDYDNDDERREFRSKGTGHVEIKDYDPGARTPEISHERLARCRNHLRNEAEDTWYMNQE